jgi:hypothetical protein
VLSEHPASTAVTNTTDRIGKRAGKSAGTFPISFKQVESNALGGLLADAGHTTKPVNQSN